MIFTTEGQLVWCSAVNSRRLFCGDFGDVFLYLRMFLKVKNQMPKFKCWFLLAGFLLDYLHVNRCYAVGKMVIWLGLIYNVIDLRKYSFIIYCKCYEYCIWNPNSETVADYFLQQWIQIQAWRVLKVFIHVCAHDWYTVKLLTCLHLIYEVPVVTGHRL